MNKIKVANPVVELDGDEMTRVIWHLIKTKLILPYLDIDLEYYDLGMEHDVFEFPASGVTLAMYNLDNSIRDFARASMNYALQRGYPLYLSTKNTILKAYDGRFKDIFAGVFADEFADRFKAKGLTYEH